MTKIKTLLTTAFLLTSLFTFGQTLTPNTEEQPYIEVTGTAENEVIPDEIYITITLREKYVEKVKISIEEQENKLKNALKSLGIDLTNLYLSDADADYVKIRWQTKDVLTKKEYELKVTNATTVGQVFQELEKIDITDASIAKVNHSKMDSLRKEVKIKAIKAAKNKADYLLAAIGEQTGKPLIIREIDFLPTQTYSNEISVRGNRMGETKYIIDDYLENNKIQFQKIKIQTSIFVKFSIK